MSNKPSDFIPLDPDYDDPFAATPGSQTEVECLHCGKSYPEEAVRYGIKPAVNPDDAFWWCPTPGCDGAGVGFDIHPKDTLTN